MHHLLVTSIFPPTNGGSAVVYEKLATYCPNNELVVLAPTHHFETGLELTDWRQYDAKAPFRIYRTPLLRPISVHSKSKLYSLYLLLFIDLPLHFKVFLITRKVIKKHDIKLICVGEINSLGWLGSLFKNFYGIKFVGYIHGEEVTTNAYYGNFMKNRRKYLHYADKLVAVSKFTRDYLINGFRIPRSKINLIPNGVDLNLFHPAEKSPMLLERYNIQGKKILLTVGRLVARKGLDKTIEALPSIIEKYPDIHYLIVGSGPYLDTLTEMVNAHGLKDYVTFAGKVSNEELVAHYQLCDIFVMPNRTMPDGDTEGFGLVFLEANACGKPVIGGKAGGAVEAVIDGVNGISVNGHNPENIANAVLLYLDDPEFYADVQKKGLTLVESCRFERCAELYQQMCYKLLND